MSFLDWLSAWANVPFAIAGLATLLFAVVQASGLLGLLAGGGDADAEGDVDADADVEADVDADVDADADAEADGDADGDTESDSGSAGGSPSLAGMILAPLAIGRVPVTLTAQSFSMTFALAGLAINAPWAEASALPLYTLAWTLPCSMLAGYAASSLVARIALPIVDDRRHAATARKDMVGAIGVVISSGVSPDFGEVRVRDRTGHDVRLVVKLAPRSRPLVEREEIVIVDVDERGTPHVSALH